MFALHHGYYTFAVHHERSLVPAFFKISIDHLSDNLQSKNKLMLWKKVWEKISAN